VGLFIPLDIDGVFVTPLVTELVSLAIVRGVFFTLSFTEAGDCSTLEFNLGTTEGRLEFILDAVDDDSVGGRDDFNPVTAVDGRFEANVLGFSMFSTNYCNFEISLFIVSI
tara:strand:- start:164 stop:496 length:333 start_codon:yes stop_codon:yes gene_type:complete